MAEIVYVEVLGERAETWLPMPATQVQASTFLLHEPTQDIANRDLEYPPGSLVRCERRLRANGILGWFATAEAD